MTELLAVAAAVRYWAADGGSDPTGLGPYGPLVNLGAVGLVCAVLLTLVRSAYQREVARGDELAEQLRQANADHATELRTLNAEMRDKQVPVMAEAVRVLADVTALMRERR